MQKTHNHQQMQLVFLFSCDKRANNKLTLETFGLIERNFLQEFGNNVDQF